MDDTYTTLSVSFGEKDVLNMDPLQRSAENCAAGYPTSYRIHHDKNFMCEFCLNCSSIVGFQPATAVVNLVKLLNLRQQMNDHKSTATSDMSTEEITKASNHADIRTDVYSKCKSASERQKRIQYIPRNMHTV